MSIRRSKLDIILNVLSSVQKGEEKPTRIMYSANLSWKPTQKILGSLVNHGLLREINVMGRKRSKRRYEITEKGVNVLRYFEGAKDLIDVDPLTLDR
jgi:predicted transcriptional regulator